MVKCPHCRGKLVCAGCGKAIEGIPQAEMILLEELAAGRVTQVTSNSAQQTFLVVARGHKDLLKQLQAVVGEFGWVRVIEDRRGDPTLLPRIGREGSVHIDAEIELPPASP